MARSVFFSKLVELLVLRVPGFHDGIERCRELHQLLAQYLDGHGTPPPGVAPEGREGIVLGC